MAVRNPGNSVPVAQAIKNTGRIMPNRLYMRAPQYSREQCEMLAKQSAEFVRSITPRLSGRGAAGIKPYWGVGWFGIRWDRPYLWYQEAGINPFTMNNLPTDKPIPMWIDDPTGAEAKANPKAEKRRTENGRQQILIFRKVAKKGARKKIAVRDREGRLLRYRTVPASYPGAPGRIARRSYDERYGVNSGKIARLVPRPHVGVRWRHPGIVNREFMQHGLQQVGEMARLDDLTVYATYRRN
jgi:hypothetical protein